jgi:hypothetical protein
MPRRLADQPPAHPHRVRQTQRLTFDTLSAGIGHPLVARESDQLIRLSTGAPLTPPSPAVRNHRNAVRLALESVSALHRIPHPMSAPLFCSWPRLGVAAYWGRSPGHAHTARYSR